MVYFWVTRFYDYSVLLKQEKIGECFIVELRLDPKEKTYAVDVVDVCNNTRDHRVQTMHQDNAEFWFDRIVKSVRKLYEELKREGLLETRNTRKNRRNNRNPNYNYA